MNVNEWAEAAIEWFKSGRATDEHWEIMAASLLVQSEIYGLEGDLDDCIFNLATERGANADQLGDSLKGASDAE